MTHPEKEAGPRRTSDREGHVIRRRHLLSWGVPVLVFVVVFHPVILQLVQAWNGSEEYSHGFLVVPLCLWMVWRDKDHLAAIPAGPSSWGLWVMVIALVCYILAAWAAVLTLAPLAMIAMIHGMVLYLYGTQRYRAALFPLVFLIFMVPVPSQIYSAATIPLQLLVTRISTAVGGMIDIPILRQGNLIHLPEKTLQVVEACSGLRSIMALSALSALAGYLFLRSLAGRLILFLLCVPVAIVINIIRVVIMMSGFYYFGADLTEGAAHTILGMLVFSIAMIFLYLGVWVLDMMENRPVRPDTGREKTP